MLNNTLRRRNARRTRIRVSRQVRRLNTARRGTAFILSLVG
jgi:hypothetical protein